MLQTAAPDAQYGRHQPSNERKLVTILCADIFRSTDLIERLGPEEAIALLEPPLVAMRRAIRQFRGIVSKEQGDGIVALFGAPIADDGHAIMACHAALELVRLIELLEVPKAQVRVGLHSGYVVTHTVHGEFTSIYEAGGPAAHLVNRIEQAAEPGQIYVSESCRELAEGHLNFLPLAPRQLKGFSHPIQMYRLSGASSSLRWHIRAARGVSKFVGRAAERTALEQAALAALSGPGQIVAVVGEPGIVKSRLVHEFVDSLSDWRVVEAAAAPTMLAKPYATIRAIVLSLLGGASMEGVEPTSSVHQHIPADFPLSWRTAIDAVVGHPIKDPTWDELDPTSRRHAIVKACRWLIQRSTAQKRTAILLEDVHWIDEASEAVLEAMISLAEHKEMLFILTSRSDALPKWLDGKKVCRLSLTPLDHAAAETLLDALLGESSELNDLKGKVLRHTGRVPLFIEEVVKRLVETGVIAGSKGQLGLGQPIGELGIPPTIQGVIAARIDRLPRREKSLLQVASGIGIRANVPLISAVSLMSRESTEEALRSLEVAGLLLESNSTPARSYEFPHDLIREVAYESILQEDQTRLHERILYALEHMNEGRLEEASESLSYHAMRGKIWPKAASHAQAAARKCLARSALGDAARYFEMSVDATDRLPSSAQREMQAIDLRLEARRAFSAYGKLQRWLELSAEAEQRAVAIADGQRALAAAAVRAAAMNFYSTPPEAIAAGVLAVQRAEHIGAVEWLSYADYGLGQAYQTAGFFRRAERRFAHALDRLSQPGAQVPFGSATSLSLLCLMMKSIAHTSMGEFEQAELCQSQAVDLASSDQLPSDIIAARYGRGFHQLRWGDLAEAHTTFTEALDLARRNEVRYFVPIIACQLAKCRLLQGDAPKAHEILSAAKHDAETSGHTFGALRASNYLAFTLEQLGDISNALALARATRLTAEQQGFEGQRAEALYAEAVILGRDEQVSTAQPKSLLRSVIEIADRTEARPQLAAAKELLGSMHARDGDSAASRREFTEASELLQSMRLARPFHPIQFV